MAEQEQTPDDDEQARIHGQMDAEGNVGNRLNWLRAAVLGANDGIVSVAGILIGVAGASASRGALFTAGLAGLTAGAMSMAVGEYVSVSAQRDTERGMLALERRELAELPDQEFDELVEMLVARGMTKETATIGAREMTEHDALRAHADLELGINIDEDRSNPVEAAIASAASFTVGGLIPFLGILLSPHEYAVPVTVIAVVIALFITGFASARLGRVPVAPAIVRNILGGLLAMAITYGIGRLFGTTVS